MTVSPFGSLIRNKRKEKGLTLQALADQLGVSKATISKYERGYITNLKRDKLLKLSDILGLSPLAILNNSDYENNNQLTVKEFLNHLTYLLHLTSGLTDAEKQLITDYIKLICKNKGE